MQLEQMMKELIEESWHIVSGTKTGKSVVVNQLFGGRQGRRELSKFLGTSSAQQANRKRV